MEHPVLFHTCSSHHLFRALVWAGLVLTGGGTDASLSIYLFCNEFTALESVAFRRPNLLELTLNVGAARFLSEKSSSHQQSHPLQRIMSLSNGEKLIGLC
jgi:hypothetical protein